MSLDKYKLRDFCDRWQLKVDAYNNHSLADLFDKFFTLFVIYNRLYVEAGKLVLGRDDHGIEGLSKKFKYTVGDGGGVRLGQPFPDRIGATKIAPIFLSALGHDLELYCKTEILHMIGTIKNKEFYFYYDYKNDRPDFEKDISVAEKAKKFDASAVLDLIYVARCNMFHGSKEFDVVQSRLLKSMNKILEFIIGRMKVRLLDDIE